MIAFFALSFVSFSIYFGCVQASTAAGDGLIGYTSTNVVNDGDIPNYGYGWTNFLAPSMLIGGLGSLVLQGARMAERSHHDPNYGIADVLRVLTFFIGLAGLILLMVATFEQNVVSDSIFLYVGIGCVSWVVLFELMDTLRHRRRAQVSAQVLMNDYVPVTAIPHPDFPDHLLPVPVVIQNDLRQHLAYPGPSTAEKLAMWKQLSGQTDVAWNEASSRAQALYKHWKSARVNRETITHVPSWFKGRRLCHRPITTLWSEVRRLGQASQSEKLSLAHRHDS